MHPSPATTLVRDCAWGLTLGLGTAGLTAATPQLGPEQLVQANGAAIGVSSYSVPAFSDWNNDGLRDLVLGDGTGKVRVYLNSGSTLSPVFGQPLYPQSNGLDLAVTPSGCLGAFPRVVYWDSDDRKDLLVGQGDGSVRLFRNTGTDAVPSFDGGSLLQAGPAGAKTNIAVGSRATCSPVDWNNDGKKDLMVGSMDGYVRVYLNQGTDTAPDLASPVYAQSQGANLYVSSGRSSPVFVDLNGDGKKDLLCGNTEGQLLFYENTGTIIAPSFAAGVYVPASNGSTFDLAGSARSRPFVCDWDGNGWWNVLVGGVDGKVHLYTITPEPGTLALAAAGLALLLRRRPNPEP